MDDSGIFAGLDIGTSTVKVIIAEYINNQINIIGYGNAPSAGLSRGVIVDIDQVVGAIQSVVKEAEQRSGKTISEVTVGIPANMLQIERCRGVIAVSLAGDSASKEITSNDVWRVTQAALVQNLPPEREVIDIIPEEFIVDGFDGIQDPRGMLGVRMEMDGIMYTGPKTIVHNVKKCIERAGLEVNGTVVMPLAVADVALTDDERDFGAVTIDIGGGQTTAAVIHDHQLKYTYVDQEGGDFVTRDISVVLNTSIENAELLKQNYGYADTTMASKDDVFPVQVVGQQEPQQITEEYLAEIIEARLEQIFEKLRDELEQVDALSLPGGVVLTGGTAALPGIKELAEDVLDVNVRVYVPQEMNLRDPKFTGVLGLTQYIARQRGVDRIVKDALASDNFQEQPLDDEPEGDVSADERRPRSFRPFQSRKREDKPVREATPKQPGEEGSSKIGALFHRWWQKLSEFFERAMD